MVSLLHAFQTYGAHYVYHGGTNAILSVTRDIYEAIRATEGGRPLSGQEPQGPEPSLDHAGALAQICDKLAEQGISPAGEPQEIRHPADRLYSDLAASRCRQLVLEVTRRCNLRCRYCPFTRAQGNRAHSNDDMAVELAKAAIRLLLARSTDADWVHVTFYGGEPLLALKTIVECVDFLRSEARGKRNTCGVTTNATLLDRKAISLLAEREVDLTISVDGPKEHHDQNRVYPTGAGSFADVMKAIELLYATEPDYAVKHVKFNSVLDPSLAFCDAGRILLTLPEARTAAFRTSLPFEVAEFDRSYDRFFEEMNSQVFRFYMVLTERMSRSAVYDSVFHGMYAELYRSRRQLEACETSVPSVIHPSGPCVPGVHRLYVTVDGFLYPCERVSLSSAACCLGHVSSGIDEAMARQLLNIGTLTPADCKGCWAVRLCSTCCRNCDNGERLDPATKLASCGAVRGRAHRVLRRYCTLKEFGIRV